MAAPYGPDTLLHVTKAGARASFVGSDEMGESAVSELRGRLACNPLHAEGQLVQR